MATDMTASGSPEEKLRWAFKMYDKDGSGKQINRFWTPSAVHLFCGGGLKSGSDMSKRVPSGP